MASSSPYSIQRDAPWVKQPATRGSHAPSASIYSEDYDHDNSERVLDHPDMPSIPPLKIHKSYNPSYHAHPTQQVQDHGPQVRQSKLPIFKQVRSILQNNKPARIDTSGNRYTTTTGENTPSSGKTPDADQAIRKNVYDGAFQVKRNDPRRLQKAAPKDSGNTSPVSVLLDDDVQEFSRPLGWDEAYDPVSPVSSDDDGTTQDTPRGLGLASVNLPETPYHPSVKSIKRKPAPGRHSLSPSENIPPPDSPDEHELSAFAAQVTGRDPISHFSWTTAAPSPSLPRPSTDTRHSLQPNGDGFPASRFSWSTVNTNMTHQARPASPPHTPPPPVPAKYKAPPVQSIVSRHRPIPRLDREVWGPPARKAVGTPDSAQSKLSITPRPTTENAQGSAKKLPPPPDLLTPVSPMSHLQELETQEQDKVHQRRNIQRAIADLSKIENASPMDVSFAEMKEAKKKLEELRKTLEEVQLEEREIGIAIARTRRKEGGEEGLWVRRVTS